MSAYTIGEIVVWLLLAVVLGFALGWLVREIQVRAGRETKIGAESAVVVREPVVPVPVPTAPEPVPVPTAPEPVPVLSEPEQADPEPALIKGKKSSMIYHAPSSSAYARTKADVWFRTEDEAVAAGYRKPKNA